MGIQDRGEVSLIRHAYVQTVQRRKGIGEKLLRRFGSRMQLTFGGFIAYRL